MKVDLSGRTIVVTGGTKGIGAAIVRKLYESGARVVFQGRDEAAVSEVVATCVGADAPEPMFIPGDMYSYDDVSALIAKAVSHGGTLSGLVASGGGKMPRPKPLLDTDPDHLLNYFSSRAIHRVIATRAAAEAMRVAGYGKIVLITSDAGRVPTPSQSLVGAASAAVSFFTRAAARELVNDGVRVNAIAVSLTTGTPPHDNFLAKKAEGSDEVLVKAFKKLEASSPFGLSTSPEIADIAAYFQGSETDGITGATLSVNRGTYFPSY